MRAIALTILCGVFWNEYQHGSKEGVFGIIALVFYAASVACISLGI